MLLCLLIRGIAMPPETTVVIVKPGWLGIIRNWVENTISSAECRIIQSIETILDGQFVCDFYASADRKYMPGLTVFFSSSYSMVLIVRGEDAIAKCLDIRNNLRQLYGNPPKPNDGMHASDSKTEAAREAAVVQKYLSSINSTWWPAFGHLFSFKNPF